MKHMSMPNEVVRHGGVIVKCRCFHDSMRRFVLSDKMNSCRRFKFDNVPLAASMATSAQVQNKRLDSSVYGR